MINHNYSGIHPDWIEQINHNLTTQEVIEEEIDFKNMFRKLMIKAPWPNIFLIRLMIIQHLKQTGAIDKRQQSDEAL